MEIDRAVEILNGLAAADLENIRQGRVSYDFTPYENAIPLLLQLFKDADLAGLQRITSSLT